jgi:hypothetical protein
MTPNAISGSTLSIGYRVAPKILVTESDFDGQEWTEVGGPVPPSDFLVDQSTPELFLENCVAGSSQYSLNAKYGKIWKRGGHFPMATFTSDGGSVVDY